MQINFTVASAHAVIYEIDKETFLKVIQNDKKLLKTILKMMMEEFDPIDPQLKNLDFERPNKNLHWYGDRTLTQTPENMLRAEKLSKKLKEAFIVKVLEMR